MRHTTSRYRYRASILLAVMLSGMFCTAASANVSLIGVQYQEDVLFSEYECFWNNSNYPTSCSSALTGANAHVFIKNDGASAVTLDDATLAGYSLSYVLKEATYSDHIANSIWIRYDNPPQDLLDAGEPAWYKMDPASIPAGGCGQVIVRLRRVPTTGTISVGVDTSANTLATTIAVDADCPKLANVSFSEDLKKIYLTWRRSGGAAPTTVKMDGVDVASDTVTVGDASTNFAVSVITKATALTSMSYHVFQGIYSDSATATGGVRAWVNPFVYCSWGAFSIADGDSATAQTWISTCQDRGINALEMTSGSGGLMDYLGTSGGKTYADNHNYGIIKDSNIWGTWSDNPRMWFIDDEPDIEEYIMQENFCGTGAKLPCGTQQAGSMGQHFVSVGEGLRATKDRPTTINMDGTNTPEAWFAYGQLSDCLAIDHYFQPMVRHAYYDRTNTLPLFEKATMLYADARLGTLAAEPNPFRRLLHSCETNGDAPVDPWPWAPPECKRIEAYYSMAAGAKGLGYWWFIYNPSSANGLGGNNNNLVPQDAALWEEIGLIGAEMKTLRPYIVTSHPVDLDAEGSTNVWVKALARGTDTLILFAVNDNYWLDEDYHGTDTTNATVTVALPSWMLSSPSAFEVSRAGVNSVSTSQNGGELTLSLGTLSVAKILFVTTDPQLMMTVRQRYDTESWTGIHNFAPSVADSNTNAPSLVRHPSAQAVVSGGTATFSIAANGGGTLTYQWQKNSSNVSDGGHYAGCTTPVLTVSSVDTNDVTNYRCKITNTYGSATSNQAALTITTVNITQHPSPQNVCSGSNASFSVTATGSGTLYYQWQKDSTNQSNGGHYSGCTTATLTVTSADTNDAASYRCKVTDSSNTAYSNTAALTIKTATSISTQPSNQTVGSGDTATFSVVATGYGTVTYQWQKDGVNQSDSGHYSGCTTATLTVSPADTNDEANYRCIVTGGCGSVTSNQASLSIDPCLPSLGLDNGNFDTWPSGNVGPNWTSYSSGTPAFAKETTTYHSSPNSQKITPPTSGTGAYAGVYQTVNANVGDAITFVAWAYANSNSSYETARVGARFDGSTSPPDSWQTVGSKQTWTSLTVAGTVTVANGATVFLDVIRVATGTYYSFFDDVVEYRAAMPPAPTVTAAGSTSLNVNVDPGCNSYNSNIEFAVTIGGGAYTLGTHWVQANGTVSTTTVWQTDSTWGTKTVTGLSTGVTYTFKVKARYSSTYSQASDLGSGATGAPQSTVTITQQPSAQSVCSGANASFTVAATGSGTITYQWQKAQANISNGGHYSGCTTATLSVTGADTNDVANYRCKVSDSYDSVNSNEAALSLKSATAITAHPSAQNICPGSNASFSVAATGDGTLTYQWQKTQANISNGGHYSGCTTATLTVTGADTNDAYNYRCKVTGGCGSANSNEAALTLKTATSITTHPSNQSVGSGETATFTVVGAGDGTLTYQWQKNSSNQADGGHYSGCTTATLTISTADTNDAANYRCIVTATCGSATSNQAALTVTNCITTSLLNGNFEDWPTGLVAPNWTGAYSTTITGQFARMTSPVHGGSYAQKTKSFTNSTDWAHVYQGFATNVGDAITITGYLYSYSNSTYTTPQVGVNTSSSRPASWLYSLTSFTKQSWTATGSITCNASGTTTYVFLESKRAGSAGDTSIYWDDFVVYRAQVPPAPTVAWASSTSLNVNVAPGCNSGNSSAEYAITVSGGAYTEGTHWVQSGGTVSTGTVWQTDSTWGNKTVTGLSTGTTYTFKVKARYSSTYTQATSLGSGAQGTP